MEPGNFGQLHWKFGFEEGEIYYARPYDNFIKIWWTGNTVEMGEILTSDWNLIDITHNLDYFVQVEKKIYSEVDTLKNYTDELRNSKKSDLPALAAEMVQQSKM